ncbi:MAG: HNH endonuclease signature motif containing protein [Hyphomonas sp.]
MARVVPGDVIISFANATISDIGVARSSAASAALPTAYITVGENWDRGDGWLVPVDWLSLEQTVRPQDIIAQLGPLLPERYSPVRPENGHGNQAAYLSQVSQEVLDLILSKVSARDRAAIATLKGAAYAEDPDATAEDVIEQTIADDPNLDATEKESLSKSRRGQGIFKDRLKEIERGCRLTGVTNDSLLIASHILAWKSCTTSQQRLDGHNGLLLTPDADRLFDRGHISFKNDGSVLVKDAVSDEDLGRLGLAGLRERNVGAFTAQQQTYLEFHRNLNGFSESS